MVQGHTKVISRSFKISTVESQKHVLTGCKWFSMKFMMVLSRMPISGIASYGLTPTQESIHQIASLILM